MSPIDRLVLLLADKLVLEGVIEVLVELVRSGSRLLFRR